MTTDFRDYINRLGDKKLWETKEMRRDRVILKNIPAGHKIFAKFTLFSLFGDPYISSGIWQNALVGDISWRCYTSVHLPWGRALGVRILCLKYRSHENRDYLQTYLWEVKFYMLERWFMKWSRHIPVCLPFLCPPVDLDIDHVETGVCIYLRGEVQWRDRERSWDKEGSPEDLGWKTGA